MAQSAATATTVAAVVPTAGATAALRPIGATDVRLTGGFWAERARINREATIPAGFEQLQARRHLQNFRLAARSARDGYRALGIMFDKPFPFLDSDVYKWLEGAGWELGRAPDARIRAMADEAIGLVEAAQRPDGYLNTFVQVLTPGNEYRDLQWGHELYCIGHLVQAAVAWHRALGDDRLLLVAERACASVERELGPAGRDGIDGHPEIEMALVELFRVTGERRWLELATSFIDRRGRGWLGDGRFGRGYWQDHLPVREAPAAVGHAVRQLYLDSGAVDVAVETGDDALLDAVHRRWRDMVATQDVPHRRARQPPQGRGVRRPVRAAAGPRLRGDVRGDRVDDARLAAAARDRRPGLRRPHRAHGLQRGPAVALDRGHGVLLREPAPAPDAPDVDRSRATASGRRGTPAPAARRT